MMRSRDFRILPHKNQNVHAVFETYTLEFCTRVECAPAKKLQRKKNAGNVGTLKTQISQKLQKPKISVEKKKLL